MEEFCKSVRLISSPSSTQSLYVPNVLKLFLTKILKKDYWITDNFETINYELRTHYILFQRQVSCSNIQKSFSYNLQALKITHDDDVVVVGTTHFVVITATSAGATSSVH